jgi:CBS-domain-containing membrane protein
MSALHVRDVMTSDVVTVAAHESIKALEALMSKKRIRHVPVVDDDGAVVGLISERDVLQKALFQENGQSHGPHGLDDRDDRRGRGPVHRRRSCATTSASACRS